MGEGNVLLYFSKWVHKGEVNFKRKNMGNGCCESINYGINLPWPKSNCHVSEDFTTDLWLNSVASSSCESPQTCDHVLLRDGGGLPGEVGCPGFPPSATVP